MILVIINAVSLEQQWHKPYRMLKTLHKFVLIHLLSIVYSEYSLNIF